MNKKNIATIAGIIFTTGALFFLMAQLQTPSDTYGLLEPILGVKVFNTSAKHNEALGIETAKISEEETKKLNEIIEKVIRAQEEYNSTKKEESLDKVKDLYLPGVFETYREESKKLTTFYDRSITDTVETLKFSSPRTYKNLSDRIGIISLIEFSFSQNLDAWPRGILQVFIFKNINGEWKIEKQKNVAELGLEKTESNLMKQIVNQ